MKPERFNPFSEYKKLSKDFKAKALEYHWSEHDKVNASDKVGLIGGSLIAELVELQSQREKADKAIAERVEQRQSNPFDQAIDNIVYDRKYLDKITKNINEAIDGALVSLDEEQLKALIAHMTPL
jgi:hypothetical protein